MPSPCRHTEDTRHCYERHQVWSTFTANGGHHDLWQFGSVGWSTKTLRWRPTWSPRSKTKEMTLNSVASKAVPALQNHLDVLIRIESNYYIWSAHVKIKSQPIPLKWLHICVYIYIFIYIYIYTQSQLESSWSLGPPPFSRHLHTGIVR